MDKWLRAALNNIHFWLEFQVRTVEQARCIVAVVHRDQALLEQAFGYADLATEEKLTRRYRFRMTSYSKSFTAAYIMKF